MLKFSGYPRLIRGQTLEMILGAARPPDTRSEMLATLAAGRGRPEVWGAISASSPNIKQSLGGVMALGQACPPEYQGAQCAFKDSMIH
jgi:hypothetical protein